MFSKLAFSLTAFAGLALGGVHVHPDDPYAALAATATSYEDWAIRIAAVAKTGGEPVPSPSVSAAEKEIMEHFLNGTVADAGRLSTRQSRVFCDTNAYCWAPDAGTCVSRLASYGERECRVGPGPVWMCTQGRANVVGTTVRGESANSCANVARAAGRILDLCTHSDNQVTGQSPLDSDSNFNVIISG